MTRFYWTTGLSINFKASDPPELSIEWADLLHSWTAVIPPTHTHTHTHTHIPTQTGVNTLLRTPV